LAERLRAAVEQVALRYNGQKIEVTVSIGFAVANSGMVVVPVLASPASQRAQQTAD